MLASSPQIWRVELFVSNRPAVLAASVLSTCQASRCGLPSAIVNSTAAAQQQMAVKCSGVECWSACTRGNAGGSPPIVWNIGVLHPSHPRLPTVRVQQVSRQRRLHL
eukprot:SAG31_NODE_434_length_15737_cov_10.315450_9_plen_107_part_00